MKDFISFCEKLGSVSPAPGGGAAAGLALSMASACVEKAARFSKGEEPKKILDELVRIREKGHILSDEDQTAFLKWQDARKLPKQTDEKSRGTSHSE